MEEQAARSSHSPSYRDVPRIQVYRLISMSPSIDKKQEDYEFEVNSVGSFTTFFMLRYNSRGDLHQPSLFLLPIELGEILLRPSYQKKKRLH